MDPEIKIQKYISARTLSGFWKARCRKLNFKGEIAPAIRHYPVPTWHMDPEIKKKNVFNRMLSGF